MSRVGYARVSTADQDPDLQLRALTAAGVDRIYTEHASGAARDRPELAAVLDYVREGDVIVVWKLDRLGRSLGHLIELLEQLHARGVQFVSLTEGMDTGTPAGRLLFHVVGALAEFERALIRERTAAGLAAARARGRVGGRPGTVTATKLEAARGLLAAGRTVAAAADAVGVTRQALYRALDRSAPPATKETA